MVSERRYPASKVRGSDKRSYPTSKVREPKQDGRCCERASDSRHSETTITGN